MTKSYHGQRKQGQFNRAYTYDGITGVIHKPIHEPYRWVLRHMREVYHVTVVEQQDHTAIAYVTLDQHTILSEYFGSYELANKRYERWSNMHGFTYANWPLPWAA
jgi:hypothetical protein